MNISTLVSFILVFSSVLFLYIHVYYHYRTSNELEVYELSPNGGGYSSAKLESICSHRQPVLFSLPSDLDAIKHQLTFAHAAHQYPIFDVKIRDNNDYIPLHCQAAWKLLQTNTSKAYFSENNADYLQETTLVKLLKQSDFILRPQYVFQYSYDMMCGTIGYTTPFRYEWAFRTYLWTTDTPIKIKLCPPMYSKYLDVCNDYEHMEFRANLNPWNPQKEYIEDFCKIKCMEITIPPGKTLYLPAYWWYSVQFTQASTIIVHRYHTFMSTLSNIPKYIMNVMQNQNIHREVAKRVQGTTESSTSLPTEEMEDPTPSTNIEDSPSDTSLL